MKCLKVVIVCTVATLISGFRGTYPINGYQKTGIARLAYLEKMVIDSIPIKRIPQGAFLMENDIKLNLATRKNHTLDDIMIQDEEFKQEILRYLPQEGYSATILDMTDPENLKYAAYRAHAGYQPGSVGKIMVLHALFDQLASIYPNSWEARLRVLKCKKVSARYWGEGDHHIVPIYNIALNKLSKRRVTNEDRFSLYEWLDHMVSVSNNGAASVVWREALLMAAHGDCYEELTDEQAEQYFKDNSRQFLTTIANDIVNDPMRRLGISENEWRLGKFFTRSAARSVGRKGGSIASPLGLMKFLIQLEQGNVVDENSSLEMKKLLYLTDRRIRYAASPKLDNAAVYFKSGSFYKCDRSKDPNCKKYAGNIFNYMNSVIIVEHPNGVKYIVCLMSNVLNKNSAGAHMYLASSIDKTINYHGRKIIKPLRTDNIPDITKEFSLDTSYFNINNE